MVVFNIEDRIGTSMEALIKALGGKDHGIIEYEILKTGDNHYSLVIGKTNSNDFSVYEDFTHQKL